MEAFFVKISLVQFLIVIGCSVAFYFFIDFLFQFIYNWKMRNNSDSKILHIEPLIRRITILSLGLICIGAFIMLNPFLHGFFFILAIGIGFDSIRNIVLGTMLQQEIEMVEGRSYKVHVHQGILLQRGWTGLKFSSSGNKIFIPYTLAYKYGISAEQKSLTYKVRLEGSFESDNGELKTEMDIRSMLFPLPYLIESQIPEIHVKENNIYIEAGLVSEEYLKSLTDYLSTQGIITQQIEN